MTAKTAFTQSASTNNGFDSAREQNAQLLAALHSLRDGNFSVRLPSDWTGVQGKIADAFNDIAGANDKMARDLERVGRVVGKEGKIRQRARFSHAAGAWRTMEESINNLLNDLV
jgi:hypothetical protein